MRQSNLRIICATMWLFAAAAQAHAEESIAETLGFTPESAVVAGISTTEASSVFTRLGNNSQLCSLLLERSAAMNVATQLVSQLGDQLASAGNSSEIEASYQTALGQLESARTQLATTRNELFEAVTVDLSSSQIGCLEAWQSSVERNVPASFRVSERTDEEWDAIERALRAEKRAIRTGQTFATEHSAVLTEVRSEMEVTVAEAQLSTSLAAMTSVFQNQ